MKYVIILVYFQGLIVFWFILKSVMVVVGNKNQQVKVCVKCIRYLVLVIVCLILFKMVCFKLVCFCSCCCWCYYIYLFVVSIVRDVSILYNLFDLMINKRIQVMMVIIMSFYLLMVVVCFMVCVCWVIVCISVFLLNMYIV